MNTSSSNDSAHERLIRDLVTDLIPVRRLRPPSVRALAWLAVVAAIAITLALMADLPALGHRTHRGPRHAARGRGFRHNRDPCSFRRIQALPAGCAPSVGVAATPSGAVVDRLEWVRLPTSVVRARDTCGRPERGARLPHLYRFIVGAAVGVTYHNAATGLPTVPKANSVDCRPRLCRSGRDTAHLLSPV